MEKIDLKDRKILFYLDLDSRQSLSNIGNKVAFKAEIKDDTLILTGIPIKGYENVTYVEKLKRLK